MSAVQFRSTMAAPRVLIVAIGGLLLVAEATAQVARGPAETLERTLAAAESALRDRELQLAESRYRTLLFEAWMMLGELHVAASRLEPARDAFLRASASVVEATPALHSLALPQP
jgi:Tfp pilus assembly protein PilX